MGIQFPNALSSSSRYQQGVTQTPISPVRFQGINHPVFYMLSQGTITEPLTSQAWQQLQKEIRTSQGTFSNPFLPTAPIGWCPGRFECSRIHLGFEKPHVLDTCGEKTLSQIILTFWNGQRGELGKWRCLRDCLITRNRKSLLVTQKERYLWWRCKELEKQTVSWGKQKIDGASIRITKG